MNASTAVDKAADTSSEVVQGSRTIGDTITNTFSIDTRADKVRAYNAIENTKSLKKEKMVGKPFVLTNVLIREETYVDSDSGRVSDAPSVIMETADGTAYYMSSATLAESVQNILTAFGSPREWDDEPLTVQVVSETSARGFDFYRMVPVI